MKTIGKAITVDGHLVRLDEKGRFFRLNGDGMWIQISTKELYELIDDNDISRYMINIPKKLKHGN